MNPSCNLVNSGCSRPLINNKNKQMKKRYAFLLMISILLISIYIFRYKRALNFNHRVPRTATALVNIDLRQLEHHVLVDFFKNPFTYISFKSSKTKDRKSFIDAISIPRNILFFNNDSNVKGAWFSSFIKVNSNKELTAYLVAQKFNKTKWKDFDVFSKNNIVLAVHNNRLVVAYKMYKETSILYALEAIFNETDFYPKTSAILKPIITSRSDMSFITLNNDFLEANFKKGLFEITGHISSDIFMAQKQSELPANSVALIVAKINKKNSLFNDFFGKLNQSKFKELTHLSVDSIARKWNGTLYFNLKSVLTRTDTIITYDYDDNFNKIEKKATQKVAVPELVFNLEREEDAKLYDYLLEEKAIQIVENDTLFTAIPIYKLYAHRTKKGLEISTDIAISEIPVKENMNKLNAYFDIEKYMQYQLGFTFLPTEKKYIELIKKTSIQLSEKDELSLEIDLINKKRNFLGQFIKP